MAWHAFILHAKKDIHKDFFFLNGAKICDPFVLSSHQKKRRLNWNACVRVSKRKISGKKHNPTTVNLSSVQCQSVLIICQSCWICPYDFVPFPTQQTHTTCVCVCVCVWYKVFYAKCKMLDSLMIYLFAEPLLEHQHNLWFDMSAQRFFADCALLCCAVLCMRERVWSFLIFSFQFFCLLMLSFLHSYSLTLSPHLFSL